MATHHLHQNELSRSFRTRTHARTHYDANEWVCERLQSPGFLAFVWNRSVKLTQFGRFNQPAKSNFICDWNKFGGEEPERKTAIKFTFAHNIHNE